MASFSNSSIIRDIIDVPDAAAASESERETKLVETQLYVGLNDSSTKTQRFDTKRYTSILKTVCMNYAVPFSFDVVHGGYIHDDGEYTEESSIVLTFIDVPKATIDQIALDLCVFFNQESVLITTRDVYARAVHYTMGE